MLLPSGPDTVQKSPSRKTRPSTPLTGAGPHKLNPRAGVRPRYSGLRVQGTATSPSSTAKGENKNGGESGIRTHETVSRPHALQACAFIHSAISPCTTWVNAIHFTRQTPRIEYYTQDRPPVQGGITAPNKQKPAARRVLHSPRVVPEKPYCLE